MNKSKVYFLLCLAAIAGTWVVSTPPHFQAAPNLPLFWKGNVTQKVIQNLEPYTRVNVNDTLCIWNTTYSIWLCLNGSWNGTMNYTIFTGSFTSLNDTFPSYVGRAGQFLRVNASETGVESAVVVLPGEFFNGTFNSTSGGYVYNDTDFDLTFNETKLNQTVGLIINSTPSSGGLNKTYFVGLSTAVLNGDWLNASGQNGYGAGDSFCVASFVGSHVCQEVEIIQTIQDKGFSAFPALAAGWASSGGSKFAPAPVPADDCLGWTDSSATHLGGFWIFDAVTGGFGATVQCGVNHQLACCR